MSILNLFGFKKSEQKAMQIESSNEKNKKKDLECVQVAIQRLMEQRKNKEASGESAIDDDDDDKLLSKLLSQLESFKREASSSLDQPKEATTSDSKNAGDEDAGSTESESDEIIKELKKVSKQNSITHWLLSIMIVLTITWQLSEVSLILTIKDRVSHPFRSFGGMLAGMLQLKGPEPHPAKILDDDKQLKQLQIETPSLPHLTMPELPPIELPDLNLNSGDE